MHEQLWKRYLKATRTRGARPLVERALAEAPATGRALDLGCGAGGDTLALLTSGYRVLAVDALADAIAVARERAEQAGLTGTLETSHLRLEQLELEPEAFALIVAGFSLPFCPPEHFDRLWADLFGALVPGGVFAGQLFGDRDQWADDEEHPARLFLGRAEVERRLEPYEVLSLDEEEERRATALGDEKDWHLFHVLARKPRR